MSNPFHLFSPLYDDAHNSRLAWAKANPPPSDAAHQVYRGKPFFTIALAWIRLQEDPIRSYYTWIKGTARVTLAEPFHQSWVAYHQAHASYAWSTTSKGLPYPKCRVVLSA